MQDFNQYLKRFEHDIVGAGITEKLFGRIDRVSVRRGKLAVTPFARKMGGIIETTEVFAIDYYGYIKKSGGLICLIEQTRQEVVGQVKSIEALVVHLPSIRIEWVAKLDSSLVADFPKFKKEILDARGFRHNYEI